MAYNLAYNLAYNPETDQNQEPEPVTKKDVEELQKTLTELKTDVTDLKTNVSNVSKDVDGIVNAVGLPVGYLALASVILNIILFIAVIVIAVKSLSKKDIENAIKQELNRQNYNTNTADKISRDDLQRVSNDVVSRLGEELRTFQTKLPNLIKSQAGGRDDKKKDIEPLKPSIIVAHGFSSRPAPKSIEERCKPESEKFMREFNSFQNKCASISNPLERRKEETAFRENHKIRTFKCSNVSARMHDPVPTPVFADDNSSDAIFWAYELPLGYYAVVPFVKNYTDDIHEQKAMGDVFKSNFEARKIYKNISVKTPAIFDLKLNLLAQGELVLSNG